MGKVPPPLADGASTGGLCAAAVERGRRVKSKTRRRKRGEADLSLVRMPTAGRNQAALDDGRAGAKPVAEHPSEASRRASL